ncbi:MAG: hypothetical protein HEEMFOPI_01503 [Holosporales bacterium]
MGVPLLIFDENMVLTMGGGIVLSSTNRKKKFGGFPLTTPARHSTNNTIPYDPTSYHMIPYYNIKERPFLILYLNSAF